MTPKAKPHVVIVARAADPHRQSEALRAALGLTLRGATVEVLVEHALASPTATRATSTLRSFGYTVTERSRPEDLAPAIARADAVEVWT